MSDDLDFSVVLKDFTTDAGHWRELGDVVREAYKSALQVGEVPFAVTDGLSYAAGFREQYNRLAGGTAAYLLDGADAFADIADRLDDTRREYEQSEEFAEWQVSQAVRDGGLTTAKEDDMTIATEAQFNESVRDIGEKQNDITDGIGQCISTFNNYDWGCLGDLFNSGTKDKIAEALTQLRDIWEDFLRELVQLASPGQPFWFLGASETWMHEVKQPLSGNTVFLSDAADAHFPATQSWTGDAGRVYRVMPGVQNSAVQGVVGYAGDFADHLYDHGMEIIDLWVKISGKFIDYAQVVTVEVLNYVSADPTKWLDIVAEITKSVSALIDWVQEFIELIYEKWTETRDQMHSLENSLSDVSGSIGGKWPTTELLS